MAKTDVLMRSHGITEHAPHVYTIGGQGNSLLVDLGAELLLVDSGPGGSVTQRMIREVRQRINKPVAYIVYSHGHMGYNNGVQDWVEAARANGEEAPRIIAHERVRHRFSRYLETAGLQSYTNSRQFRSPYPATPPKHWFAMPESTYEKSMVIYGSERHVELIHAPSETDDGTAVWIPESRVLYGSNAFIKTCPNSGSPYRILRDPMVWARTLEKFIEMKPAVLIPEFGKPLTDESEIFEALTVPVRAIHYLREQVLGYMNQGMKVEDIVHSVRLPAELFENRYLKPSYGCAEYIIRDIWRCENGWWNRNPSDLHPASVEQAAQEILAAIDAPQKVIDTAGALLEQGEAQLALHIIDLLALADDTQNDFVRQARELKAAICRVRATQVTSFVSRSLYLSSADELMGETIGLDEGHKVDFEWV